VWRHQLPHSSMRGDAATEASSGARQCIRDPGTGRSSRWEDALVIGNSSSSRHVIRAVAVQMSRSMCSSCDCVGVDTGPAAVWCEKTAAAVAAAW
jgi:hypothetical protein